MALVTPWLLWAPDRFALLHGDYRLDNLLFDGDRVAVVDWQTLGVGLAGRDLAYFTGTSLEPELRAEVEHDLVADYHRALQEQGVSDYDLETCWQDYRLGMIQVPLISALGCAFSIETERGDDMMAAMLRRGCQAIRDLGTLDWSPPSRSTHGPNPAPHSDHRRRHQRTDVGQDAQGLRRSLHHLRTVRPHRRQLGVRQPQRTEQRLPLTAHRHLQTKVVVQGLSDPGALPVVPAPQRHQDLPRLLRRRVRAAGQHRVQQRRPTPPGAPTAGGRSPTRRATPASSTCSSSATATTGMPDTRTSQANSPARPSTRTTTSTRRPR